MKFTRCPRCQAEPIFKSFWSIHAQCPGCGYNFQPEPGFYLGAMSVSFLITAMLTVPPMAVLWLMKAPLWVIGIYPFLQFLFLGSFLIYYSRVIWLHLEYRLTQGLNKNEPHHKSKKS